MRKKILALIVSFILIFSFTLPAYALNSPSTTRLTGNDEYATSSAIAQQWGESDYAVLTCGNNFPDALSAAPLAKKYNAPILLTANNDLSEATKQTLMSLYIKHVFIIGGSGIISFDVENQLNSMNIQTTRIYGKDRYDTSVQVAKQLDTPGQFVVCTGTDFADALSIAPIAAIKQIPILFVPRDSLPDSTRSYLSSLTGITTTYVVGDSNIISDKIVNQLPYAERITGSDQYGRNIAINQKFDYLFEENGVCLTTGNNFTNALTGAAFAAKMTAPVFFVKERTPSATKTYYQQKLNNLNTVYVFGDVGVVPDRILNNLSVNNEVQFTEYLSGEIQESVSFNMAKQLNAVVIINGEVITPGNTVNSFMKNLKTSKDIDLFIFNYHTKDTSPAFITVTHFYKKDDTLYLQTYGAETEEGTANPWDQIPTFDSSSICKIDSLTLNPYGFILYTSQDMGSVEYSQQVINQRELFDDMNERFRLSETYLNIFIGNLGLKNEWDSPAEITEKNPFFYWFYLFEDIYTHKMGGRLDAYFEAKDGGWVVVPISSIQETFAQYFDGVTRQMIIDSSQGWYNKELDAVVYGGGRGGEPPKPFVVSYEEKDQTLTINYIFLDVSGAPVNDGIYRLIIEFKPDGSFRYRSNKLL